MLVIAPALLKSSQPHMFYVPGGVFMLEYAEEIFIWTLELIESPNRHNLDIDVIPAIIQ